MTTGDHASRAEHDLHVHPRGPLITFGARAGVIGPGLFAILVVTGGTLYNGYSHTGQKISELGGQGAEFAVLQNVNFIVSGLLVAWFAWALGRTLGPPYRGPALIGAFGISSFIANGLLPCDVACVGATPVAQAHNVTGLLGFLAAITGMLILARRWRHHPRWRHHVAPTVGAAAVAIAGLIWFIATVGGDPHHPLGGISQRVFVGALLVWIARTAWLLHRHLTLLDATPPVDQPSAA